MLIQVRVEGGSGRKTFAARRQLNAEHGELSERDLSIGENCPHDERLRDQFEGQGLLVGRLSPTGLEQIASRTVIRDLYNVRVRPVEDAVTPLTDEEERRFRAVLFSELGNEIADRGWVRFPAYTQEDRRRLVDVAHRLAAHWGQQVFVEAEDHCGLRLFLAGYEAQPKR
ncbi:hypothetical protein [Streptomyces sp. NPDC057696]|uniref:hypothetical protein n=1 Tax=Streptomyces sp. NPDC057696 TaxID=3346218 RepID=UPI0036C9A5AC